jgi:hypothetical protein
MSCRFPEQRAYGNNFLWGDSRLGRVREVPTTGRAVEGSGVQALLVPIVNVDDNSEVRKHPESINWQLWRVATALVWGAEQNGFSRFGRVQDAQ